MIVNYSEFIHVTWEGRSKGEMGLWIQDIQQCIQWKSGIGIYVVTKVTTQD